MFSSFFPRPRWLLLSFALYALLCVLLWFYAVQDWGVHLSLGRFLGFAYPAELLPGADAAAQAQFAAALKGAQTAWAYQWVLAAIALFALFWGLAAPHPWRRWSVAGSALIFFTSWFLVQLQVLLNDWFGVFYDMVQRALAKPNAVSVADLSWQMVVFLKIAMIYVVSRTLFDFFVSHYVFRWRTAMNEHYARLWPRLRHIEGASQRIQEDTMRFASITEGIGTELLDSLMTLVAFLPILWKLSEHVRTLPVVGALDHGLVYIALIWAVLGTGLVALAGIRLPGLEFRNQLVEAAYRKELVYGEDDPARAAPAALSELFTRVRSNYFRRYLNYLYFGLVRHSYLQISVIIAYIAMAPAVSAAAITLGVMQQVARAFAQVQSSFQFLVNSWGTIVEWLSIYKRLKAFEAALAGEAAVPERDAQTLD